MELAYLGTNYHGWQRQPNAVSVQGTVEGVLGRLLGRATTGVDAGEDAFAGVEVVGCGRTDTGVHAARYVAHFDVSAGVSSESRLRDSQPLLGDGLSDSQPLLGDGLSFSDFIRRANSMLPPDIALRAVWPVADDAHARFDAREREYSYCVAMEKDPFGERTAWWYWGELDVEAMNEAAAYLVGTHDFTSFAKLGSGNKTNICTVTCARWCKADFCGTQPSPPYPLLGGNARFREARGFNGGVVESSIVGLLPYPRNGLVFTIRADRFLRNMVRAVVGTLVDVGRGKISAARFGEILDARDLSLSSGSAPARGLFLSDVVY